MVKNLSVVFDENIKLDKKLIHQLVAVLKKELQFGIDSLQINFVNSDYIFHLNKKFLNHVRTTDIITFSYSDNKEILDGEIFISFQDALDNARKFNVNLDCEFVRLIIHGILHLTGYDDQTPSEKRVMKKKEDELTDALCKKFQNLLILYDSKNS